MKVQYVMFSSGINPDSANKLISVLYGLAKDTPCAEIYLLINSDGGGIKPAIYCYNMLRSLPVRLTTHNVGVVESVANIIFLAGEDRYVSPSASFMFHEFNWTFAQPAVHSFRTLDNNLNSLRSDMDTISQVYADRIGITKSEAGELFPVKELRVSAECAIVKRLAHNKCLPKFPTGVQLHHIP